jgi:hypothetical protein
LKYTDPSGWLFDKYFNENGEFLYDDGIGNNIRIIDNHTYNLLTNFGEIDLSETPEYVLKQLGSLFSNTNLNKESQLKIYNYFNPTDLTLKAETRESLKTKSNFIMAYVPKSNYFAINLSVASESKLFDNYYNIINTYVHENKHYDDYKTGGYDFVSKLPKYYKEQRTISTQMNHSSWDNTSNDYKKNIIKYGLNNNYYHAFPMQRLTISQINF